MVTLAQLYEVDHDNTFNLVLAGRVCVLIGCKEIALAQVERVFCLSGRFCWDCFDGIIPSNVLSSLKCIPEHMLQIIVMKYSININCWLVVTLCISL